MLEQTLLLLTTASIFFRVITMEEEETMAGEGETSAAVETSEHPSASSPPCSQPFEICTS
jgi:hypothetical protein